MKSSIRRKYILDQNLCQTHDLCASPRSKVETKTFPREIVVSRGSQINNENSGSILVN
jgi:hypothetical protein